MEREGRTTHEVLDLGRDHDVQDPDAVLVAPEVAEPAWEEGGEEQGQAGRGKGEVGGGPHESEEGTSRVLLPRTSSAPISPTRPCKLWRTRMTARPCATGLSLPSQTHAQLQLPEDPLCVREVAEGGLDLLDGHLPAGSEDTCTGAREGRVRARSGAMAAKKGSSERGVLRARVLRAKGGNLPAGRAVLGRADAAIRAGGDVLQRRVASVDFERLERVGERERVRENGERGEMLK